MKTKLLILALVIISAQSFYALRLRASSELHAQQIEALTKERDEAQQRYVVLGKAVTTLTTDYTDHQLAWLVRLAKSPAASNVILQPAVPLPK